MSVYTRDMLDSYSIFAIRDIAKKVGVSSPTKINKSELIDLIMKITSGEMAPPVAPKRGRPRKNTDVVYPAEPVAAPQEKENRNQGKTRFVYDKKEYGQLSRNYPSKTVAVLCDEKQDSEEEKTEEKRDERREYVRRDLRKDGVKRERTGFSLDKEEGDQLREGFLELNPDGYGFLRVKNGECNEMDAYVHPSKIKQYGLRKGDFVVANCKSIQDGKPAAVVSVVSVNGIKAADLGRRPNFDDLVPIYPDERLRLEIASRPRDYAIRCIDLVAPIGKGQRGIIVSPPKAGKTTLLKMIAGSIAENYPDIVLYVLLIDERPEEVTDMQRSVKGEVVYSTFDEMPEHHTKTAEMLLDRAKRQVEMGKDVVILMDSLTRLARAYNTTIPPTGRTLSGGVDPGALHSPKRFFGSARNIEHGGSLTIIATALIDTGSRMDEVIFEEFKGTGNMEIHLDRKLSERRIFPAIDLAKSGTRKEELLLTPSELAGTWGVRKMLSVGDSSEATENLLNMLVKTSSNKEFVEQLNLQFKLWQKEGYNWRKPTN